MKKLLFLVAIMSLPFGGGFLSAQTTEPAPSEFAMKKLKKDKAKAEKMAKKAQEKAEKEAKKAAKKQGTAEVTKQCSEEKKACEGGPLCGCVKPELKTPADSLAYIFGAMQANGLKEYLIKELEIDTTYMEDFYHGMMARVNVDPADKQLKAKLIGQTIGGDVEKFVKQVSKQYYGEDSDEKIDGTIVARSMIAALKGTNEYTAEKANELFRSTMNKKQAELKEKNFGSNREAGEKFLAANAKKPGVKTLPGGVQYKVLKQGTGEKPKATDKVSVNYEGHLIDGTEFDSSYKRNKPTEFKCNQVIKGWTEALTNMPVGSKWEVYIPQDKAYGDREMGDKIKPYSALIFTVELLSIVK